MVVTFSSMKCRPAVIYVTSRRATFALEIETYSKIPMKMNRKKTFLLLLMCAVVTADAAAGIIRGTILDKSNREALTGATIQVVGTPLGAVADVEGHFLLPEVKNGTYTLAVNYVGYQEIRLNGVKVTADPLNFDFALEADAQALGEVTVVARVKKNTDVAMMTDQRRSLVVQSGVSAQQITKTQDKDASEVIKRVPGVSLIDEKFVMVRGLSQRYNNVWMNGGAVPSSEADSRAFSFDMIPSSQLDHLVIVKSPAPEYPSDFTGGFILIHTQEMPEENSFHVSLGAGVNDRTHFRSFLANRGSGTDFLGFDNGLRSLAVGMKGTMNTYPGSTNLDVLNNGLHNDWRLKTLHPAADGKLNLAYSHRWDCESGQRIGLLAAVNYANTYKSATDMENSLYGVYDTTNDQSVYMRHSRDNQYSHDARLGAMLNLTFEPRNTRHRYEWKNLFNQLGKNRYTERRGFNAQNDAEHHMEYYYASRTTYNTQFTGKHTLDATHWDWSAGYAYANRNLPDRRRIELNDRTDNRMGLYRISREFTRLDEHIASASANYEHTFAFGSFQPVLKAGAYGEYRTRTYRTRQFDYSYNPTNTTLPSGFQFTDNPVEDLLTPEHYGADKLYLQEEVNKLNDYQGNNSSGAGYAAVHLPYGAFSLYAGVRYEYNRMELVMNTRAHEDSPRSTFYTYSDLFPSVNATYALAEKQQLRLAYGKSVNRPEFRELSTSVFYDFDLASDVKGNADLQAAYIHNLDLRYEWYPASGELFSVALFYKRFNNPIEWTYTVSGGTNLLYSYKNARAADTYGIEVDLRKTLDFIGLRGVSWSFNGSLIQSNVRFAKGSAEKSRAMQGQSPYLVNTGFFYQHPTAGLTAAVLYNRIGKRIVGVGRSVGTSGAEDAKDIPNSYEMPRNTLDLSAGKKWGRCEVKVTVRDLLAERITFQQMDNITVGGQSRNIAEVTKQYKPGRNYALTVSYNF